MTARVRTTAGADLTFRSSYLIGCDGGTSTVRATPAPSIAAITSSASSGGTR